MVQHQDWEDHQDKVVKEHQDWEHINHNHHLSVIGQVKNNGLWNKKIRKGTTIRKKQSIQLNSNTRTNIIKPKLHKNIPMSNHDLIKWCKYLKIPINEVLSRDQTVPHNHKQALFIYNLEPSYMSGSHWVTTYVKDNVINYFDSFGMPPFQELVNHAKRKNITLLQNLKFKISTQLLVVTFVYIS